MLYDCPFFSSVRLDHALETAVLRNSGSPKSNVDNSYK